MDPRERRRILGQWGVHEPSARDAARGRALHEDVAGTTLSGRPVELRRRNFRQAVDSYIASLGGPLPYMQRLREIEERSRAAEADLEERWLALARRHADDPDAFRRHWVETARRCDFYELNRLIDVHNRWYPAEARLPMDVRRRDYVLVDGKPYRRRRLDAAWILDRFPPELTAARATAA